MGPVPEILGIAGFLYTEKTRGVKQNNRNLATFNLLNWFTQNSYVELPMSQRMAVYFDSWAENTIVDAFSGIGQALSATPALMGIGGIVGGMFSSSDSYILYML